MTSALPLRGLPPRVALFQWRARRMARRAGHAWGLEAAAAPSDLAALLRLARGRREVVELGTGPAWTAIALGLADSERRVTSYDPVVHDHREDYLALVPARVRERIRFVAADGAAGAPDHPGGVEMLFVDSTHERAATVAELRAWEPRLADGAVVALHDYGHPDFPGVAEAVRELGLQGEANGGIFAFVH
ncbi:MAG TPA: class I SAM-dependent methyltransferase [Solirubrobacteraceae bacterium]|jgi:predicted O-methyltransferase YrrM|nr:class I SAM-dependent methyltransferase [Solirubrobacteraceae bacterium]